ncbi:biliverdin-producing heme oxygenase [Mucilaginibacter sp. HC2]|uniref:biliverdin-producing heme oxygenase n=1 Tax=Mucilaginibacter inviolabilis TaxID=2714892 RepID=UPI001409BE6D|nr:biliverdin-producing heme oxygenase [Mucilaginibacter inviolabilis]NHA03436.1 biliverdin-producing heme oxygenase [Mucilaginibacter inviolabilis]
MIQDVLRNGSAAAHQQLEKIVVTRLKAIKSKEDYAALLKYFYAFFSRLEEVIAPYMNEDILPDKAQRRNSGFLANDMVSLGQTVTEISVPDVPEITNVYQALGAFYVMEGSIMGGSIIVQMLAKLGITDGVSFFSGYGPETGSIWGRFIEVLNKTVPVSEQYQVVETATDTFHCFALSFDDK